MKKSTRRSRRHRNPQTQSEDKKTFFSKSNDTSIQTKSEQPFFQTKLTVGQTNDKYEQEADAVADAVVNNSDNTPTIQQKKISSIQRYMTNAQEDEMGTNTQRIEKDKMIQEKPIQRMEAEEEEPVQKMESEEEEQVQMKEEEEEPVQMMEEEEESIQKMEGEEEESVQMMEEEEESVQMKSNSNSSNSASPQVAKNLKQSKGSGSALPKSTRAEMENSFGVDFSQVKIHTNDKAIQMNKDLGAQAFTHGKDVYFNDGKFSPTSHDGKKLLAHELTHVVQQNGGGSKEKSKNSSQSQSHNIQRQSNSEEEVILSEAVKKAKKEARFASFWANFPKGSVEDVKKKIGGRVDADWVENTCAIRVSRVLNYSGYLVPYTKNKKGKGATISGDDKKWYFFRIKDLRPFIEKNFGKPDYSFEKPYDMDEIKKHKGIILFDVDVWKDATGHYTLWNGETCADKCFFEEAKAVHIWEI